MCASDFCLDTRRGADSSTLLPIHAEVIISTIALSPSVKEGGLEEGEGRSTLAPSQPSPTPLPPLLPEVRHGVDSEAGAGEGVADLAPSARGSADAMFVLLPGVGGCGGCCGRAGDPPDSTLMLPPRLSPPGCFLAEPGLLALSSAESPMPPPGEGGSFQDIL